MHFYQSYSSNNPLSVGCTLAQIRAFPVTVQTMEIFAAVLFYAGYKAACVYVSAVLREARLMHQDLPQSLLDYKSFISRALRRDSGEAKHMLPVLHQALH